MRAALPLLLCITSCIHLGAADATDDERAVWRARIKKVSIGMRRAEVERLLPPYQAPSADSGLLRYSLVSGVKTGGSQSIQYYVSPGWLVSIPYDYTGIPRDASGRATDYSSPDNRVLAPVTLKYRLLPPTTPRKTP